MNFIKKNNTMIKSLLLMVTLIMSILLSTVTGHALNLLDNENNILKNENEIDLEFVPTHKSGYGVYINNNLITVYHNKESFEHLLTNLLMDNIKKYDTKEIEILSDYKIKYNKYDLKSFNKTPDEDIEKMIKLNIKYNQTKKERIKFKTEYIKDNSKSKEYRKIINNGKNGIIQNTYEIEVKDGKINKKKISSNIIKKPINKKIIIGTGTEKTDNVDYVFPVKNAQYYISSEYGQRGSDFHKGIDLAMDEGSNIVAYKDGVVVKVDDICKTTYGKYIEIQHYDGTKINLFYDGKTFVSKEVFNEINSTKNKENLIDYSYNKLSTLYAHLSEIYVEEGETVTAGQLIAKSGNTGRSTGPHLHFETRFNNIALNPAPLIK